MLYHSFEKYLAPDGAAIITLDPQSEGGWAAKLVEELTATARAAATSPEPTKRLRIMRCGFDDRLDIYAETWELDITGSHLTLMVN